MSGLSPAPGRKICRAGCCGAVKDESIREVRLLNPHLTWKTYSIEPTVSAVRISRCVRAFKCVNGVVVNAYRSTQQTELTSKLSLFITAQP